MWSVLPLSSKPRESFLLGMGVSNIRRPCIPLQNLGKQENINPQRFNWTASRARKVCVDRPARCTLQYRMPIDSWLTVNTRGNVQGKNAHYTAYTMFGAFSSQAAKHGLPATYLNLVLYIDVPNMERHTLLDLSWRVYHTVCVVSPLSLWFQDLFWQASPCLFPTQPLHYQAHTSYHCSHKVHAIRNSILICVLSEYWLQ